MYCGSQGLTKPSGYCKEGYYCGGGSSVATPDSRHIGYSSHSQESYSGETCLTTRDAALNGICLQGHFCPMNSSSPQPCAIGTNSTSLGLTKASQCQPCSSGFVCNTTATIYATIKCPSGFWCGSGTSNPYQNKCLKGHSCALGSALPLPCEAGFYQDEEGQASCKICPSRHYCLTNTTTPVTCPQGSFCLNGTRFGNEYLCPNGTFGAQPGLGKYETSFYGI